MIDGNVIRRPELLDEFYIVMHQAYDAMRAAFKFRACDGLTQDIIAKRLAADKGLISRRLNGAENLTLKTLSFMASAMNCRLSIYFTPYEELGVIHHVDARSTPFRVELDIDDPKPHQGVALLRPKKDNNVIALTWTAKAA